MKNIRHLTVGLCLLVLLAPASVLAAKAEGPKARLMTKYDTNQSGVIDGDEIVAVRAAFAAEPMGDLKKYDANKDGKLDDAEIALIKGPGSKSKGDARKEKAEKVETKTEAKPVVAPKEDAKDVTAKAPAK